MAFQVKKRGRPNAEVKLRSIKGITPRGFAFQSIDQKQNVIVFKRKN